MLKLTYLKIVNFKLTNYNFESDKSFLKNAQKTNGKALLQRQEKKKMKSVKIHSRKLDSGVDSIYVETICMYD